MKLTNPDVHISRDDSAVTAYIITESRDKLTFHAYEGTATYEAVTALLDEDEKTEYTVTVTRRVWSAESRDQVLDRYRAKYPSADVEVS